MLINYRIKTNTNIGKWSDKQYDNKDKEKCDMCGSRLYVAPDGKTIYCDKEHNESFEDIK